MCLWWVRPIPAQPGRLVWLPRFRRSMASRWPRWPRRSPPRTCARVKAWTRLRPRLWFVSFRSWARSRSSGLQPARHARHRRQRPRRVPRPCRRQCPRPEAMCRRLLLQRDRLRRRLPPPRQALGRRLSRQLLPLQPVASLLLCRLSTPQVPNLALARLPHPRELTPLHHAQFPPPVWCGRAAAHGWRRHPLDRRPDVRVARTPRRRSARTPVPSPAPTPSAPTSRQGPSLSSRAAIPTVLPTTCRFGRPQTRGACATSALRKPRGSRWIRIPGTGTWSAARSTAFTTTRPRHPAVASVCRWLARWPWASRAATLL